MRRAQARDFSFLVTAGGRQRLPTNPQPNGLPIEKDHRIAVFLFCGA
jgi:hypothetical protein